MLASKAIEDIIDDAAFWDDVQNQLAQRMANMNARAILMGLEAAAGVGVIVDFDAVHAQVLEVSRNTSSIWWGRMTETTREALRQALITWTETGVVTPEQQRRGLRTLIEGLEPLFGRTRAERIATTETTRLFAEGNRLAADGDDSVGGLQWQTGRAEQQVCGVCWPRNGKIYPKGAAPDCPAHPNCYCSLQPASWDYIRQHPGQWQGGPLPPEMEVVEPEGEPIPIQQAVNPADVRQQLASHNPEARSQLDSLDREIEGLNSQYVAALQKWRDYTGGTSEQARAYGQQLINAMQEAGLALTARRAERAKLWTSYVEEVRQYIYVDTPAKLVVHYASKFDAKRAEEIRKGLDGASRLTGLQGTDKATVIVKAGGSGRSNATGEYINITKGSKAAIVVHEMGHWIEHNVPGIREKTFAFLERRTQAEKAKWLGDRYNKAERAKVDNFIDPYMGKDYFYPNGQRRATEVLSMGLQYMYADPIKLAMQDPDYFDFIFNLLRGL